MSTAPAPRRLSRHARGRADQAWRMVSAALITIDSPFQFN